MRVEGPGLDCKGGGFSGALAFSRDVLPWSWSIGGVVHLIKVPFRVPFVRLPYYIADLPGDPDTYPCASRPPC